MSLALVQPGYDPAPQTRSDRLRRLMTAAIGRNAVELPALGSAGPAFSCAASANPALTQTVLAQTAPTLFTAYGGSWAPAFSNRVVSVTAPGPATKSWSQRWSWRTDSVRFDINVLGYTVAGGSISNGFRLMVDGQYVSKADLMPTVNGGTNYLEVDWSAVNAAPTMRRYDLEFFGDSGAAFRGLLLSAADIVQPVSTRDRYRIGVIGDSITMGKSSTSRIDGYVYQAGKLLGGVDLDMVSIALPGTGYIAAGTGPVYWPFASHLDDVLLQPYDEIWLVGGVNDPSSNPAALQAAALATFQGVRARLPAVPVLVWGVFANATATKAVNNSREAAIKAAYDQWADRNAAWVPMQYAAYPPQTGFSDVAGNSARLLDTDLLHPIDQGAATLARWFAEQRRSLAI